MNTTSETNTGTSRRAEQQTFIVLGVLLQFLSTPEQISDQISVMHGTVPSGVVIPLHSHADPEIFYVLDGSLEVFQAEGPSSDRDVARHKVIFFQLDQVRRNVFTISVRKECFEGHRFIGTPQTLTEYRGV